LFELLIDKVVHFWYNNQTIKHKGVSMTLVEKTDLYFTDSRSDKVYSASILKQEEGYVVNYAFGARGCFMKLGTKTKEPVELKKAEAIYNKLVKSKKAKGYVEDENGVTYTALEGDKEHSGISPQLLNEVSESDVIKYINSDKYVAQEKFDGERHLLIKKPGDDNVKSANKKGVVRSLAQSVADSVKSIDKSVILDTEGFADHNMVFDALYFDGKDLRGLSYRDRLDIISSTLEIDSQNSLSSLRLVETAYSKEDKQALFDRVKAESGEGVVFKKIDAKYESGRPSSGGDQLKFKFYATASVVVTGGREGKRSVSFAICDDDNLIEMGNVTIPPNKDIPEKGSIIEVRYLYAYRNGSLYQPTYLDERGDTDRVECSLKQLKYKQGS